MSIRFSVLVPAYNAERFLHHAIDSILEQTQAERAEVIVIDDGSSDATPSIARRYEHCGTHVRVVTQEHAGTAAARNRGLALSRGDIIVLLDHDDELHPLFLERMADMFRTHPSAAIVFTDAYRFDEGRGGLLSRTLFQETRVPMRLALPELLRMNFVSARAAIRKDVLAALGGFDESLSGADDYDAWLRILAEGYGAVALGEPLAYYRLWPESQSASELAMVELTLQTLTKARATLPLDPDARVACELALAAWRERVHLLRAAQSLQHRKIRQATRDFVKAWKASPLRWRTARVGYFAIAGLTPVSGVLPDRTYDRPTGKSEAMRRSRVPIQRHGGAVGQAARDVRRRLGWNAQPRRGFVTALRRELSFSSSARSK